MSCGVTHTHESACNHERAYAVFCVAFISSVKVNKSMEANQFHQVVEKLDSTQHLKHS